MASRSRHVRFSFVVHNHQPIGNFDSVFAEAYEKCYQPFIEVLDRHPNLKFTQHWTGTLLEWIQSHHPEFIQKLRGMVARGQLEVLTGAYYEAILPVIPPEDRVGQIRKLSRMVEDLFGCRPRGMWLAERVWEPHLVSSLAEAGVEFVLLDDTHFRAAGVAEEHLTRHYRTEDGGRTLDVVPIDKALRYLIPFHSHEDVKHYLQGTGSDNEISHLVHADDGEKFGVWPRTHASVYGEGWLETFCSMLSSNDDWLRTVHLSESLETTSPRGRIYLPSASYHEMMKWALPTDQAFALEQFEAKLDAGNAGRERVLFVRGGFWRNFLSKYPESNHMHKRMLRIATRLRNCSHEKGTALELEVARDFLWAGQCNDAYWHGVFGGLYLPNLRFPIYRNLIRAESALDQIERVSGVRGESIDFDCDGHEEVLIEGPQMNLYLKPATGGHLLELDYKPVPVNLLDILSRRQEAYHRKMTAADGTPGESVPEVKEKGLEKLIHFDWYRHASLVDHFFADSTTLEEFRNADYLEIGDFVDRPYDAVIEASGKKVQVTLQREGTIWSGEQSHRIHLSKTITCSDGEASYETIYRLRNLEKRQVDVWFGVEFNVGLMAGDAPDRFYEINGRKPEDPRLRSVGTDQDVVSVRLVDQWLGVATEIVVDKPATLWRAPIETVSLSEGGLERVYQSSMIVAHWKFPLNRSFTVRFKQSVEAAAGMKKGTNSHRSS
ncbi:MAG: DUF1926 domain-containing protein [Ignavibacteria bacterium]|nr:DUF1926 domain-containing protein [Ignavibacteria bacterium]